MQHHFALQVVLADHFDAGPFADIWQRLSHPYHVTRLNDPSLAGHLTCFRHITFAHYVGPGKAFLGYEGIGSEHTCPSTLLMAGAHWQRYLFKDLLPRPEQMQYEALDNMADESATSGMVAALEAIQAQHRRLNVVWLSRTWFSRSMKAGGGLTGWQASRALSAQQELDIVTALEQAVLQWNDQACAPPVFGWWQRPHQVQHQTGCKPSNVSFNFRVSDSMCCSASFTRVSCKCLSKDTVCVCSLWS